MAKPVLSEHALKAVIGFSGGGGIECGMVAAGIRPTLSIEFDPSNPELSKKLADNHDRNFDEYGSKILRCTVQDWAAARFGDCPNRVDFAHFSPVCSNYSSETNRGDMEEDLIAARAIAEFVRLKKPTVFTLENVEGYKHSDALALIRKSLTECGYFPGEYILVASNHGVPQTRKRLIVAAIQGKMLPSILLPREKPVGWLEATHDLIESLPDSTLNPPQIEVLKGVEEFAIVPRIGYRDKPAPTIKKSIFHDQNGNGRSRFWDVWDGQTAKAATIPFMARLQSFPSWYEFPDAIAVAGSIIGYSVPPLFAEKIFKALRRLA